MRICVVGAGVAGIQAADALSAASKEYSVHVFEKESDIGGVWRENYDGYALQVPSELYEFPTLRHKTADGTFPDGKAVQTYVKSMVEARELHRRCTFHFDEAVEQLSQNEDATWNVRTNMDAYSFEYCVVCTGMYHVPYIPASLKRFDVVHTSKFVDASVVVGKRVVVVGGGKSAIDCAVAATLHAQQVTLVQRELHWPIPRRIMGFVPFKWCTYSRLGHFLLPKHWTLTPLEHFWHTLLEPLKYLIWRLMEIIITVQFGLHKEYWAMQRLEIDSFNGGQILTTELRDAIREGRLERVFSQNAEEVIGEADIVLCGTGFCKEYGLFDDRTRTNLNSESDGLWLYKNILPPRVSNLAFIGAEVSTFNNILTTCLQSQWLAHSLVEKEHAFTLECMLAYVEHEKEWKRSWMQPSPSRASLIQLHMTKYHDILMEDMGRAKVKAHWWQWVLPLQARDYT